jgi:CO/xanthine dehydrogenase Mo-binding subunit
MATQKLNTQELAERLHTDPRKLRRFMRATGNGVGQGKRYEIPATKAQLTALQRRYAKWAHLA